MKTLREHLAQYLKLSRQLGYKLKEAEFLLRSFTTLAEEEGAEFITTKLALRWAARPHLKPGQSGTRHNPALQKIAELTQGTMPVRSDDHMTVSPNS